MSQMKTRWSGITVLSALDVYRAQGMDVTLDTKVQEYRGKIYATLYYDPVILP